MSNYQDMTHNEFEALRKQVFQEQTRRQRAADQKRIEEETRKREERQRELLERYVTVSFYLHGDAESNIEQLKKAGVTDEIIFDNVANMVYEVEAKIVIDKIDRTGKLQAFAVGKDHYFPPMR